MTGKDISEPVTGHRSPVTPSSPVLHLRSGKDRAARLGHPWIFSGAIRDLDPGLAPGSPVRVLSADGALIGTGYANPRCAIAVRLLSRADVAIDAAFIARRVAAAQQLRQRLVGADSDAYRLINGEGDGLPGVLVDRYADVLVLQLLTAGAERWREWVVEALSAVCAPRAIVERSGGAVRSAEGLASTAGVRFGAAPDTVEIRENGLRAMVVPGAGQKTGHFCDQRVNRARVRALADGRRVLDACSYSGGFAVHAGAGGAAHVVAVDSSAPAIEAAARAWALNELDPGRARFVTQDVGRFLRDTDERFDLLVLDPPALVRQRKDVARGARAYKDLNLWGFRRAAAGALLLTFTCSQHVDAALFRKIVTGAAADAGRAAAVLEQLGPGPDHPVALAHPEGEYLHGLLLRVE
ncbi:MAG: class I SAM-dependent rRNA methyltransferase [Deltaproteobacteria bacterium]|nr:class I SAM-dependent rRNA methyltransferase [Deltaproteobacteria bacterium]